MPENSNEPMGLRANGAFEINCLNINVQYKEVNQYEEVYNFVDESLNSANVEIENYRYGHFGNEGKYIYHHVVEYCDKYLGGNYE